MNISGSINSMNRSMSSSNFQRHQQQEKNDSSIIITIDSDDQMERSQMSEELRSSIPNGFIEVDLGNFAFAIEKVKNRDTEKLYVKENGLEDGFIRKYMKQGGKWKCCRCISNTTSRKRSNSSTVHNHRYGRVKEAIKIGNNLYVAKAHSSNSCKPYPQEDFEFPLCEEKPNVDVLNAAANSAPITFQIPHLSLQSPAVSLSTTQDHLASSLTNGIPSPKPCSSQKLLYSTNPANNPMRSGSTRLPPTSPRRVESIGHTVTQQQPQQISAPTVSSLTPQSAQPETATVPQQPTQVYIGHTVIQQPSPVNVNPRSDNDPSRIKEDAENYEDKENVQNNLREKSIASIPDDPVDHNSIKPEANAVASKSNNTNEEDIEIEQKYEIVSFPCFSEKPLQVACKKLNLHDSYSKKQVLLVWSNIDIQVVKSRSDSIESGEKLNGFECVSLLLTGSQDNSYELYGNLKAKLENNEELKAHYDVAKRREMSKKFCEEHLELIAHWISCRIGIYENGILKKYGDWSRSRPSNDLILLIEKDGEKYAPILSL